MTEELKDYTIVGDNNFWYSSLNKVTKKQLQDEINNLKLSINDNFNGNFNDCEIQPTKLYIKEVVNTYSISIE